MIKWIVIIVGVLLYLYRTGKKELAKQDAEKRARDAETIASAARQSDELGRDELDRAADRSERAAARVRALRQEVEAALKDVAIDPYALEDDVADDVKDDPTDYDDQPEYDGQPEYDDTPPPSPVVFQVPQERVVEQMPPPDVYAIADDTTNVAVNAQVRRDIERTQQAAPGPRQAHGIAATGSKSPTIVRDSVIMQTLLRPHAGNPMFSKRR